MKYPAIGTDTNATKIIYVISDSARDPNEFWDTYQYTTFVEVETGWSRRDLFKSNKIWDLDENDLPMMKDSIKSLFEKGIKE